MTINMTYRRATPDEIKQIGKDADEAERLYFENGVSESLIETDSRQPVQADTDADPPVIVDQARCDQRP